VKVERKKKTAFELYSTLLKAAPESGDEDSEDSEDEEFGAELDSDDSDDIEDDVEGEEIEGEDIDEEEDSELEDEEEEGLIEADFTEEPGNDSGCTAVLALVAGQKLYVANAGDSRCVVCREGKAVDMSADHKPEDEPELKRITAAGGKVTPDGRVNGGLNLSRAIGDHAYKQNKTLPLKDQMISSQPDLKVLDLNPAQDSWMILACDGIWNSMSSQEVVDFVNQRIEETPEDKLSNICEQLFDHCLSPDTTGDGTGCDNMTAVIVKFKPSLAELKDVIIDPSADTSAGCGSSSGAAAACSGESSSTTTSTSSSSSTEVSATSENNTDTTSTTSKRDCPDTDSASGSSAKKPKLDAEDTTSE